jgi:hypothetical protein
LRSDSAVYQQFCKGTLSNCDTPYNGLPKSKQALIRGRLVQTMDASCSTCPYGINLNKANQSIPLIAKVLKANCQQTKSILNLNNVSANYEDSWKFTLVSYHSGFGCLETAIEKSISEEATVDWKTVSGNLSCTGAASYVDQFWTLMQNFAGYKKKNGELALIQLQNPSVLPAASTSSNARIVVKTYYDQNGNGIQDPNEALDNVLVTLDLENGVSITKISQNGMAIFDIGNISVGVKGKINLPGLYQSAFITVPVSGDIPIIFIFTKPILPTQLP